MSEVTGRNGRARPENDRFSQTCEGCSVRRMIRNGVSLLLAATLLGGCGYTEQEWQALLDKNTRLDQRERVASSKNDELETALKAEKARIVELEGRLGAMGFDVSQKDVALSNANATIADRERALKEYQERAKLLEAMRARFEALRTKLDELTALGIEVRVRKNRMVVSLPGDVLFDSGKDKLKKGGKEVLAKVAGVLKADPTLAARDYQVAGHTDSKALTGGNFGDNWGLSLMRARQVLLYLTAPGDAGGGLPKEHWSASGYADTDPIATNDTDAGRQANRRCDIVVVPNIDEMLDLRAIAGGRGSAPPATTAVPPASTGDAPPSKKPKVDPAAPKPTSTTTPKPPPTATAKPTAPPSPPPTATAPPATPAPTTTTAPKPKPKPSGEPKPPPPKTPMF